MLLESIAIAVSQLWANKARSALTLLGMVIGVGSVVGIVSLSEGMRQTLIEAVGRFGGANLISVQPEQWTQKDGRWVRDPHYKPMKLSDIAYLETVSDRLAAVLPNLSRGVEMQYGKATYGGPVEATVPAYPQAYDWGIAEGRFLLQKDLDARRSVCVLGERPREELFGTGSPVGREVKLGGRRYLVVGVMEERKIFGNEFGFQAFVPVTTAQQRVFGSKSISGAVLLTREPEDAEVVIAAVEKALKRRYGKEVSYRIRSSKGVIDQFEQVVLVIKLVTGGIAGISLLVGGIGIMNIMLVSVMERTREIGIRKALGAKPGALLLQFIVEAVVLSLIGGLVGVAVGVGIGLGSAAAIKHFGEWPFPSVVSTGSVLLSLGISAAVGLFFGIYPAARAAQLDPVAAMGSD